MVGDAAVVVLSDGPWPGQAREQFVAALLDEEAAVLELDVNSALRLASEGTRAGRLPPPTAADLVPHVRGAAEALRKDAGAGLVAAVGYGVGGEAAVLAASLERSMPPVGGPGLVAAASLGPEPARFALVASQPRAEAECVRALAGPAEA